MLYSGPCDWAEGLLFDPFYEDHNAIALTLDVIWPADQEAYRQLISWIKTNVPGNCEQLNSVQASQLWDEMTMYDHHYYSNGAILNMCTIVHHALWISLMNLWQMALKEMTCTSPDRI